MPTFPTLTRSPIVLPDRSQGDPSISTLFASGHRQTRSGWTRIPKRWNVQYVGMDNTDRAILEAFVTDDAVGGSEEFTWPDPGVGLATYSGSLAYNVAKTITRVGGSFVTDGFIAGQDIKVQNSADNDGLYTIAGGGVATLVLTVVEDVVTEAATLSTVETIARASETVRFHPDSMPFTFDYYAPKGHYSTRFVLEEV